VDKKESAILIEICDFNSSVLSLQNQIETETSNAGGQLVRDKFDD